MMCNTIANLVLYGQPEATSFRTFDQYNAEMDAETEKQRIAGEEIMDTNWLGWALDIKHKASKRRERTTRLRGLKSVKSPYYRSG